MPKKQATTEWTSKDAPCPFENDQFFELWCKLLGMPKWKKKPLSAIEMACNRLKRFDVDFAASLVESAIEGNYQGVVFQDSQRKFELYKQQKNGTTGTYQQSTANGIKSGTSQARTNTAKNW
jgi:hypothetical protein